MNAAAAIVSAYELITCGTPEEKFDVAIRVAEPADESVVMRAWLVGHHDTGDWPRFLRKGRYFDLHKPVVQRLVAECHTLVACNPAKLDQVLGFITWKDNSLHWLYVKPLVRGNKIASALWGKARKPTECSHWTIKSQRLSARWWLRYNPFLLGEP